jgi:signal transduction histidine kinase
MRALDWSRTAVGPVTDWPENLKLAVAICLRSRFPIAIVWGRPQYTMLYNDAFIPLLGPNKHPGWLGRSARECWHETWPVIGPMLNNVLDTGDAAWGEDLMLFAHRFLPLEECYFTFSYGPIPSTARAAEGIFCACTETTERVISERRVRTLRDLAGRTAHARSEDDACVLAAQVLDASRIDVPFSLIYLLGADRTEARLAAVSGIEAHTLATPAKIDVSHKTTENTWPLHETLTSGQPVLVTGLTERFGPLPGGPWPESAESALVLPLAAPGQIAGLLVLGVSPRLVLDEPYRAFFNLLAGQLAAAVRNAQAFETERRRAQSLAELDSAKTSFFSNVSHEFRTPLTLMIGPLEEALGDRTEPLPGPQRERIDAAYRNSLRLLKLVNTLLDFARIEAGRVRAAFEPIDLAALTTELASSFRPACEQAGLKLITQCDRLPQPVYVDRDMWEKIVLNLLSNAFKFTFEGEIEVSLRAVEGTAELCVRDTGTGIPPEEMPFLFKRFHRVRGARARTAEGTGIGLALVNELVHLHRGTLQARSDYGHGASFCVRLPFGTAHLPAEQIGGARVVTPSAIGARPFIEEVLRWLPGREARQTPEEPRPDVRVPIPTSQIGRKRPLILCADDNADMRGYIGRLLSPSFEVITVADGEQALDIALTYRPDLVLTDAMMPKMDGIALLRALRSNSRTASIPIIILSAPAGEDAKAQGLDTGADDYIAKPFNARELLARVRSQLTLSAARGAQERERIARASAQVQREDFHSLFMQAPNIFMILRGPTYIVELANPAACQAVRRPHEELIDRKFFDVVPELEAQLRPALDELRRTGAPVLGREMPFTTHWRGTENPVTEYYNFVHSPLRNADGEIEGVLINSLDVTDAVVARQEMSRLRAAAEAASLMKDQFLAMLGHELRNPLAPMVTALQLLRMRGNSSREQDILERQVGHLTRLVDDLLDVSRITRGKIELRKRPIELSEAVESALEMATPLLEQRRHRLEVEVPREGLRVDADPERLAQVVLNLLTNAAKYSDMGSAIRVEARRISGERVRISVADEGVGIAAEMLDKVFDLFVQQPQTLERAKGGLGLGLTIVRNIVELHGGSVSVSSAGPGRGSEFVIELPLLPGHVSTAEGPLLPESGVENDADHPRVMIVDDNSDAAEMLGEVLRTLGYDTASAPDGPTALTSVRTFRPDVALIDIGLPVMDGYELAQRLRETADETGRLKLVAVTGYGLESDRRRAREAGFDSFLVKPVDVAQLARVCRDLTGALEKRV